MPSDKKRVNLTIPDAIYEKLQVYKEQSGLFNDATACLQLIIQQLNAQEINKAMIDLMRKSSLDQLTQTSGEGLSFLKDAIEKEATGSPLKK